MKLRVPCNYLRRKFKKSWKNCGKVRYQCQTCRKIDNRDIVVSDYTRVQNWPTPSKRLGAISAVALDVYRHVVVFHRAERVWNSETFDITTNIFKQQALGPIRDSTIIQFDRETGNVLKEWGNSMFYMPHGLHIRGNYYYITDVGKREKIIHFLSNYFLTYGFQASIKFFVSISRTQQRNQNWYLAKLSSQENLQSFFANRPRWLPWRTETSL